MAVDFDVFLTDRTGPELSVHVLPAPLVFANCWLNVGRSCFVTVWRLRVEDIQVRSRERAVAAGCMR